MQEELSMKGKVLRDTKIRSMHELGEMKRAQELRDDEVSVQKIRENHETTQNLTSQLQEMQEQMNSMSLKELIHSGAPQREQGSVSSSNRERDSFRKR